MPYRAVSVTLHLVTESRFLAALFMKLPLIESRKRGKARLAITRKLRKCCEAPNSAGSKCHAKLLGA